MADIEDLNAISRYFQATAAKNANAEAIKQVFYKWFNGLGWYEKSVLTDSTVTTAKKLRDSYNGANGDKLSFTPREMTAEDQAFINSLGSQGSFTNAVKRDIKKATDAVDGTNLDPSAKLLRYAIIGGGVVVGLTAVRTVFSFLPVTRIVGILRRKKGSS
jgi:hypothetical protein